MDYSEKLIVRGLREGDTEAYRYIFSTHYQVLCHATRRYVDDPFVAETIVGDVVYRIWERRSTIEISTSLRSYLLQSVRNASLDYLRSKHSRYEIAASRLADEGKAVGDMADSSAQPVDRLIGDELQQHVDEAVAALPAECRRVFEMSRFMGKRHAEIAEELGISVSTVKYHIRNALQLLTRQLGRYMVVVLFAATAAS